MNDREATPSVPLHPHPVTAAELPDRVSAQLAAGARLAMVVAHEDGGPDGHEPRGDGPRGDGARGDGPLGDTPDAADDTGAREPSTRFRITYTFLTPGHAPYELVLPLHHGEPTAIPTLAGISYPAGRFEREIRDLYGITPFQHPLPRRMVRHGHWPTGYYPMLREVSPPEFAEDHGSYPFLEVTGDGVYEIPVGPIHAGLIEPGHFRFFVVGETILRMKARLWFLHRGVEKLFEGRAPADGIELAERISGDTAVGHTVAFASAVEQALGIGLPAQVWARRALLLELERLYNHVNDIGAIVNDVGYGIAHTHTQALRERLLRHNKHLTGHRLLRGAVTIGDTSLRAAPDLDLVREVAASLAEVVDIALGNHVVMDRLAGTSVLTAEAAEHLGTLGYVARASGLSADARWDQPMPGVALPGEVVVETGGDVLARFLVRAREAAVSAELIAALAAQSGGPSAPVGSVGSAGSAGSAPRGGGYDGSSAYPISAGLGVVEAWRGALCHRVEIRDGRLRRVKVVDPSFFNWPALPVALKDTIVPDFPLTNKSFNQSYAGNDL